MFMFVFMLLLVCSQIIIKRTRLKQQSRKISREKKSAIWYILDLHQRKVVRRMKVNDDVVPYRSLASNLHFIEEHFLLLLSCWMRACRVRRRNFHQSRKEIVKHPSILLCNVVFLMSIFSVSSYYITSITSFHEDFPYLWRRQIDAINISSIFLISSKSLEILSFFGS